MEKSQEHVATLCAVGTVGIAAAGLALGTANGDAFLIKPGKRKSPGGDATRSPVISNAQLLPRRTVSQPVQPARSEEKSLPAATASLFRRKTIREDEQRSTNGSQPSQSRGSSQSRYGMLRPWTADRDSSTERKENRPGSSWLRRMSTLSTLSTVHKSSPSSSVSRLDSSPAPSRPSMNDLDMPNKLVKRSSSRRALSSDQSNNALLSRPATSHKRSFTLLSSSTSAATSPMLLTTEHQHGFVTTQPSFIPFFDTGYSRKRHTSGPQEASIRTVSNPRGRRPTLVMGSAVQSQDVPEDVGERPPSSAYAEPATTTTRRQKLRHSLGSVRKTARQRNFTDPIVHVSTDPAYGSILPTARQSPLSPMSHVSTFDIELPHGTPIFTSSPPSFQSHRQLSINKRNSVAPSDPTTASSDNDPRVFTDDDSMDFQSDTAYDSLATRATASSHSGFRQPKIETIFDDVATDQNGVDPATIEDLMLRTTLDDTNPHPSRLSEDRFHNVGIGITGLDDENTTMKESEQEQASTPIKSSTSNTEELMATPVPIRNRYNPQEIPSSPPSMLLDLPPLLRRPKEGDFPDSMDLNDGDDIEWSPKPQQDIGNELLKTVPSSPVRLHFEAQLPPILQAPNSNHRSSIFDWSENQRYQSDLGNGISPRPKTVHGKQGNDGSRSRPPGRKPPSAVHLRSQSVPVNRDSAVDLETASAAAKFGTWGLGNKPVSEEWSDDFEFDDNEVPDDFANFGPEVVEKTNPRDSMRSVKVPQSILERQASVHLQFGQVQEFMLLVEELKRLRVQGSSLQLLGGYTRHLWEDAESIINLATLNEEEEEQRRPASPTSSDFFGDETPPTNRVVRDASPRQEDGMRNSVNRRSISSPATSPYGRPRGESLAQAKNFLQTIHQKRGGAETPPREPPSPQSKKLPFDTQDLRDLVVRAGVITRALKEIVRKAEGVSVSPHKTPPKLHDPSLSHIFNPPNISPCPPFKKPGLPKSRSANSYLGGPNDENDIPPPLKFTTIVEAN